jgi:hypothetical protein
MREKQYDKGVKLRRTKKSLITMDIGPTQDSAVVQKLSVPWFIVGGTGNIGMCLTEKLLRCTDAKLFLLVRKSTDRILEGWQRHMSPARAAYLKTILDEGKRVICMVGDAELDNLGLTEQRSFLHFAPFHVSSPSKKGKKKKKKKWNNLLLQN